MGKPVNFATQEGQKQAIPSKRKREAMGESYSAASSGTATLVPLPPLPPDGCATAIPVPFSMPLLLAPAVIAPPPAATETILASVVPPMAENEVAL